MLFLGKIKIVYFGLYIGNLLWGTVHWHQPTNVNSNSDNWGVEWLWLFEDSLEKTAVMLWVSNYPLPTAVHLKSILNFLYIPFQGLSSSDLTTSAKYPEHFYFIKSLPSPWLTSKSWSWNFWNQVIIRCSGRPAVRWKAQVIREYYHVHQDTDNL